MKVRPPSATYDSLKDNQITQESFEGGVGVCIDLETTDGTKFRLRGPDFNLRLLHSMLQLRQDGASPFVVSWYYYDEDRCRTDARKAYTFFIVHDGKIIREQVMFFDDHNSAFDPSVFTKHDYSDPTWSSEQAWPEAGARYWYRRFYSETRRGHPCPHRGSQLNHDHAAIHSPASGRDRAGFCASCYRRGDRLKEREIRPMRNETSRSGRHKIGHN